MKDKIIKNVAEFLSIGVFAFIFVGAWIVGGWISKVIVWFIKLLSN